jgi:hypothetical protein
VGWDDPHGTARALDLLARDRARLQRLRDNALATARAWPSWEQSSRFMALALRAIHREPPPNPRAAGVRLTSDFASVQSESQRAARAIGIQRAIVEDIKAQKTWQWALAIRGRYHRMRAPLGRVRHAVGRLRGR